MINFFNLKTRKYENLTPGRILEGGVYFELETIWCLFGPRRLLEKAKKIKKPY